ncbi:hypothetical protein BSKO_02566 [Bryopsis sp. KO-2023]|nr:hypothetical protein BSKO_02566 [Bryopsis sp. KO-2023]
MKDMEHGAIKEPGIGNKPSYANLEPGYKIVLQCLEKIPSVTMWCLEVANGIPVAFDAEEFGVLKHQQVLCKHTAGTEEIDGPVLQFRTTTNDDLVLESARHLCGMIAMTLASCTNGLEEFRVGSQVRQIALVLYVLIIDIILGAIRARIRSRINRADHKRRDRKYGWNWTE